MIDARSRLFRWWLPVLAGLWIAAGPASAAGPDLSIGAEQYPDADAIILRWEQHYALGEDGAVTIRSHEWVKLLNRRRINNWADRTINYRVGEDTLIVHTAQAHLPDGQVLPIPEYGFNLGAAEPVAGWPEYSAWEQRIISFSGVQPGATLELDYEIRTQAGALPVLSADLRLDAHGPVVERVVTVTTPGDVTLHTAVLNVPDGASARSVETDSGLRSERWTLGPFPGCRNEAASPAWQQRCPRLVFSTAESDAAWVNGWLAPVQAAIADDDRLTEFAIANTRDAVSARDRIESLCSALAKRFNFINAAEAWRARSCRSAPVVFAHGYGNPLEAAAISASAFRALGFQAQPVVAAHADAWRADVPADAAFAGVVLQVTTSEGDFLVHPQQGIVTSPGDWGGHVLVAADDSGELRETRILSRGEGAASRLTVTGKIEVTEDGKAHGELHLTVTGALCAAGKLRTADGQKSRVKELVERVVAEFEVTGHSITRLTDDTLCADVQIAAKDALARIQEDRLLRLGAGSALLPDLNLPLSGRDRAGDLELPGAATEEVDLVITFPESWKVRILPQTPAAVSGEWGRLEQRVLSQDHGVRIERRLNVQQSRLSAEAFAPLREGLKFLRTDGARCLLLGPA